MFFPSLWETKLLLQGFKLLKVAFLLFFRVFLLVCMGFKNKGEKLLIWGFGGCRRLLLPKIVLEMTECCRKILNNGLNSKAPPYPPLHICHVSRIWAICLLQTSRKLPCVDHIKTLCINFPTWEGSCSHLCCRCCAVFYYGDHRVPHIQVAHVSFRPVSLLEKPPTLGDVGVVARAGFWMWQMCQRCICLLMPPPPLRSVPCSAEVTDACLSICAERERLLLGGFRVSQQ